MADHRLQMENRIKNLIWTVSGDYTLDPKLNTEMTADSEYASVYEGIKQGGLARFFDRDALSLYLIKKIFCHAREGALMTIAQLCVDEAVGSKLDREREGVRYIRKRAYRETLERKTHQMSHSVPGRLKAAMLRETLYGEEITKADLALWAETVRELRDETSTDELIRAIDGLYNQMIEPLPGEARKSLEEVLAVTLEELTEYTWKDFLSEDAENSLTVYLDKLTENMTALDTSEPDETPVQEEEQRPAAGTVVVDERALAKMKTYVEKNFGRSYLPDTESQKRNRLLCRGIHSECTLFYTEGILQNPVGHNYQYKYVRKQKHKNLMAYYENHRVVKSNIRLLTSMLRKAFVLRNEEQEIRSDYGKLVPSELWKAGRTRADDFFRRIIKNDAMDFAVDVLIDASGSQRKRQDELVLQAYIISEALTALAIPFRVMTFCTFWDYTVLHRLRDYDDGRNMNSRLFEFMTSANNRDGLAIKAAGYDLLQREEENKVLIVLSDGKPNDVVVKRKESRQPEPYTGERAVLDSGIEIRRLRQSGIRVLGIFVGEEKELVAERKIFGKDFAYIRSIRNFSAIVGKYLLKLIEE